MSTYQNSTRLSVYAPAPTHKPHNTPLTINSFLPLEPRSRVQIVPYSPLQLTRPVAQHTRQILNIIPRGNPKLPHKVLGRRLQIPIIALGNLIFRTAEIGVRGDGRGALEAL